MKDKLYDYIVSILYKDTKESMMLKAHNMKEAKDKVEDLISKTSLWNYKKNEYKLECHRIRILEGGNYEIIVFARDRDDRK